MPQFALAQLKGDVCLVQVSPDSLASSLTPSDVKVFRHEFITIFRYSHSLSVHPSDLRVLCTIDEQSALHDEEKETVWLTKDVMERLQKLMVASSPRSSIPVSRHGSISTHASMQRRQRMIVVSQQGQSRTTHTSMTRGVPTQRVVTFKC